MTLRYERVNQLSGVCLDEQIPLAWVDNHVLIAQDMSMAVGLKIEYPDTLFVSATQIDEIHNAFTSMLNQLALLEDTETRLQFITICHNQYKQMIDDYLMEMPRENHLLSQFKRDLGQHYLEKLHAGELRRYSCYLFIGIEPVVEFSDRIKRVRKGERRASWLEGMAAFIRDTLELSVKDAARITEEEWNTAVNLLSKQVQQTASVLKAAGIQAKLMPSEGLIETLYWWFNPKSYTEGVRPPPIDTLNPRPITSYFVQSEMEVDSKHGWLRMDGVYRRIIYLHEPPSMLQFGMLLPQLLAPGFVSGAFSVECHSSDTNRRLRKLKNRRLQVLGRIAKQPELRRTLEEIDAEIDELATGKDRPWTAAHSIHLWAENLDYLNTLVLEQRQFGQQNEGMTWIHETTPIFPYFVKTTPGYLSDRDRYRDHAYSSSQLAMLLPAVYIPDGTDSKSEVLLKTRYGTLYNFALHDQAHLTNYNMMIAGSSGSGKSVATNLILLQKMAMGARCVGIDIGGSYQKLCHVLGGNYLTMDLDSDRNRMNFLYAPPGEIPGEEEILQNALLIERMVVENDREQLSKEDRLLLTECIRQSYQVKIQRGEEVVLSDVQKILNNQTSANAKSLANRLRGWCRGGPYGNLFDGTSMVTARNPFTIFDFTRQKDNRDVGPVMMMTAVRFAQTMTREFAAQDKLFFIDEGWNLMSSPICASFLEEAARTYRKYGIAIVFISQGISEWGSLKNSEGIRDSISTFFLFKLSDNVAEATVNYFRGHEGDLIALRSLTTEPGRFSQCYMFQKRATGMRRLVMEMTMPPILYAATTTRPADKLEFEKLVASGLNINDAIIEFAKRYPRGVNNK
jgi:type IV secretory pathway VirB4 component